MRLPAVLLLAVFAQASTYPPAFPRVGASSLYENDLIAVWNIAWLKGQPSPLHRHVYDLTGVYNEPGDRIIVAVDGSKRPVSTKAWDIAFQLKGITHIEEGTSDSPLRAVFIEMKKDQPYGSDPAAGALAFPAGVVRRLLDNERVAVWQHAPSAAPQHVHVRHTVLVSFDAPTPRVTYIARGTVHSGDEADRAGRAFVFELK